MAESEDIVKKATDEYVQGNYTKSLDLVEAALARGELSTNHFLRLKAWALLGLVRPHEALIAVDKWIALYPLVREAYQMRAGILSEIGDYDEAIVSEQMAQNIGENGAQLRLDYVIRGSAQRSGITSQPAIYNPL